eukprot:Skav225520  [mRNA]  locus=scaffold2440:44716:48698:+ [translate_table: standard]
MDRPCAANAACWLLATLPLFLATSAASPEEPAMYCDGPRVLLFWPVDGAPRTVHQVKRNTAYVKSSLGDNCVAVFLAHYKGDGGQFGQDWYSENVVGNISGPGQAMGVRCWLERGTWLPGGLMLGTCSS